MRKRGRKIHHAPGDVTEFINRFDEHSPLSRSRVRALGIAYHMALESIHRGQGSDDDINHLAHALNIAMALCECGIGFEHLECVERAQNTLVSADARGRSSGRWMFDEVGYTAICDALSLHDHQLEMATQAEIRQAAGIVNQRRAEGDFIRLAEMRGQTL